MDLSTAQYVPMVLPGPLPLQQSIRCGALFIFRGGLDEMLIVSPQLDAIAEEVKKGQSYLVLQFSSPPGEVMEKLSGLVLLSPAFVIVRYEEEKVDPMLIGPGKTFEQGYFILGMVRMDEKHMVLAVRKGVKS